MLFLSKYFSQKDEFNVIQCFWASFSINIERGMCVCTAGRQKPICCVIDLLLRHHLPPPHANLRIFCITNWVGCHYVMIYFHELLWIDIYVHTVFRWWHKNSDKMRFRINGVVKSFTCDKTNCRNSFCQGVEIQLFIYPPLIRHMCELFL